jgi:SAM-dependent methyltransferase
MNAKSLNPAILEAIKAKPENGYLHYHAPRYHRLLEVLQEHYRPGMSILDIGRSPFAEICHKALRTNIDLLGFEKDGLDAHGNYFHFDLNDCRDRPLWRSDLPRYGIIVFSEVIEHLPTSPTFVLAFLKSLLEPGGLLVLQTPNAAVLHKRIQLLLGRNPYSLISINPRNPSHFREYTLAELEHYSKEADFTILSSTTDNYFDYRYTNHSLKHCNKQAKFVWVNRLYSCMPMSLKPGITMALKS